MQWLGTRYSSTTSPALPTASFLRLLRGEHQVPDQAIRTNEKARLRNKSVKSSLKTAVRRFREAADAGDREAATVALQDASRELDKAASKGVIHKNQAANKKSAMARSVSRFLTHR